MEYSACPLIVEISAASRVDGMCALMVLGDAARSSLPTLRVLQALAQGKPPPATHTCTYTTPTPQLLSPADQGTCICVKVETFQDMYM